MPIQRYSIVEQLAQQAREYHTQHKSLCCQHGRPDSVVVITPDQLKGGRSFLCSFKGIYHITPDSYQLSKKLVGGDFDCHSRSAGMAIANIFPST